MTEFFVPETALVDATNFDVLAPIIIEQVRAAGLIGLDTETEDSERHEGLNLFCKYKEDGTKAENSKLVFDFRRMKITGFSIFPEGSKVAYYVNLDHADKQNCVPWEQARTLLDARSEKAKFVCHNAAYEMSALRAVHGYELSSDFTICTLQMAVSAFGPDQYSRTNFLGCGQGPLSVLVPELQRNCLGFNDNGQSISPELQETITKLLAKQSRAAHSYNGFVKEIAYGYGLKPLVKNFFGYQMGTFKETLNGRAHMGQLTGAETAQYGAEDAYVVIPLFYKLLEFMALNAPNAIDTFFTQENPMVEVFSKIQTGGMPVALEAIDKQRDVERINNADVLRVMKAAVKRLLPFPNEIHEGLAKRDSWYAKNADKYRKQIEVWANSPDSDDSFVQNYQTRGALINAWAKERKVKDSTGPNLAHYMPQRTLIYDLCRTKAIIAMGKVQSDGEARGKLLDRFTQAENKDAVIVIECLNLLASIDQRLKLYLTPYLQLTDPETQRLYPTVSSMLATRRMGARDPNPMQLAKRGDSTYVRSFFAGDSDEHVVISVDWSGIELVEIGEFSGDPQFIDAFGQIPHKDLHAGAATSILQVACEGLTEDSFKKLKGLKNIDEYVETHRHEIDNLERLFTDLKGQKLAPEKAFGFWRTEVGKGANFNYWYSGALNTVGERMGWSSDTMWKATEAYRDRFPVAERWRTDLIDQVRRDGYITLPDGHTRVRFEATELWKELFISKFQLDNGAVDELAAKYNQVWAYMAGKIQRRAWNQSVNAYIQGSCATIAKRSVIRIEQKKKELGLTDREIRFLTPIHDELVYSVHKSVAVQGVHLIRDTMIDHPDLFQKCALDASPSMGLHFQPHHSTKVPLGQVELFESPDFDFVDSSRWGGRMTDDEIQATMEHLFETRKRMQAA